MPRGYRGRNSKADANQPEIVEAFRKAGATVTIIEDPLDLLVGAYGIDQLVEIKNLKGKRTRAQYNDDQLKFVKNWNGRKPLLITDVDQVPGILEKMRVDGLAVDGV